MLTTDAEVSVLGSMLIDERCVPALMQQLTPEDFTGATARHVFEAIRSLFLARRPIDPVLVLEELDGGPAYAQTLAGYIQETPTAAYAEEYARILRERRQLRQIREAVAPLLEPLSEEKISLDAARSLLAKAAATLVERPGERDMSYSDLLQDMLDRLGDKTPPDFLDWGMPAINEKLQIGPGRFVILGADSSVGKTALALQFALSIARSGKRVGFFSYETTLGDATDRLAANDADVSLGRAKRKKLGREEIARIVDAGGRSGKVPLRILETARYTVEDIRAKTIARGFQVVIVDYVQLIPTRRKERYEAVTEISIGLHALAQELGVTVIGLSQVTLPETDKKGDRRYISKDDLRESRQLKQDADVILLLDLSNPKDRDSNRVLQVAKNRDGPLAHFVLSFDPAHMRFSYVPPVEGTEEAASRQRVEAMDRNREARQRKEEQKARGGIEGQGTFEELDDDEPLPF